MTMQEFVIQNGVLVEYNGCAEAVIVPDGVTEIGEGCFQYHVEMKKITLPDGLKAIEKNAFYCCGIEFLHLPDSVEKIHPEAANDVIIVSDDKWQIQNYVIWNQARGLKWQWNYDEHLEKNEKELKAISEEREAFRKEFNEFEINNQKILKRNDLKRPEKYILCVLLALLVALGYGLVTTEGKVIAERLANLLDSVWIMVAFWVALSAILCVLFVVVIALRTASKKSEDGKICRQKKEYQARWKELNTQYWEAKNGRERIFSKFGRNMENYRAQLRDYELRYLTAEERIRLEAELARRKAEKKEVEMRRQMYADVGADGLPDGWVHIDVSNV